MVLYNRATINLHIVRLKDQYLFIDKQIVNTGRTSYVDLIWFMIYKLLSLLQFNTYIFFFSFLNNLFTFS